MSMSYLKRIRRRSPMAKQEFEEKPPRKLGQLASTAICGNDITSSCLYVSALALIYLPG